MLTCILLIMIGFLLVALAVCIGAVRALSYEIEACQARLNGPIVMLVPQPEREEALV